MKIKKLRYQKNNMMLAWRKPSAKKRAKQNSHKRENKCRSTHKQAIANQPIKATKLHCTVVSHKKFCHMLGVYRLAAQANIRAALHCKSNNNLLQEDLALLEKNLLQQCFVMRKPFRMFYLCIALLLFICLGLFYALPHSPIAFATAGYPVQLVYNQQDNIPQEFSYVASGNAFVATAELSNVTSALLEDDSLLCVGVYAELQESNISQLIARLNATLVLHEIVDNIEIFYLFAPSFSRCMYVGANKVHVCVAVYQDKLAKIGFPYLYDF